MLQTLKVWILRVHSWVLQNEKWLRKIFLVILGMSLLAQAVDLGAFFWQRAQPLSILRALDDDEAIGVGVAMRTRLYNDSDFHTYGVLYYRVVHLVQHLVVPTFHKGSNSHPSLKIEMAHDFILDLVSLMALYVIAMILAWMLTASSLWQGIIVFYGVHAFSSTPMWVQMLFAAKPDVLLCVVVLGALVCTWRVYADPENKQSLFISAVLWALAFCTKLVVLYFLPAILLLLVSTWPLPWKKLWGRLLFFLKIFLITYFGVGFPNNFTLIPPFKNLIEQSSYLRPLDWEFFQHWWSLWGDQIGRPLVVVGGAILLAPLRIGRERIAVIGKNRSFDLAFGGRLLISILLPTLWLFSKKTITFHEWYPLPFVTGMLGMIVWIVVMRPISLLHFHFKHSLYWFLLAFIFLPFLPIANTEVMNSVLANKMVCTEEATKVGKLISEKLIEGKIILADPMIPYAEERPRNTLMNIEWEMKPDILDTLRPQVLVLKKNYYSTFFPPEEGGTPGMTMHIKDIREVRAFYNLVRNKTEFIDSQKNLWRKTYSDSCTWEVWEAVEK